MSPIRLIRKALRLSQEALADILGCSQSNVSFYEGGQSFPPEAAKRLIAHAASQGMRISLDQVYGLEPLVDTAALTEQEVA